MARRAVLDLMACAIFLSAVCTGAEAMPGRWKPGLSKVNARTRAALVIAADAMSHSLVYAPAAPCTYRSTFTLYGQDPQVRISSVSLKPVRNRLLVSMLGPGENSTVLIDRSGMLYDFNLVNMNGTRSTSEDYQAGANEQAARTREKYGASSHAINDFTILYPHFIAGRRQVGDVVAEIADESGSLWGTYVYRGTTSYAGRQAVVIDLVHKLETRPDKPPVAVGFNILDASTLAPLLLVLDAGSALRVERISCP